MKGKKLWGIAIIIIAILIGGYFVFVYQPTNQDSENKEIVISQAFQHLLYIGLYVADDAGFFEEEGLDVRIETAGGDDKAFAALASGNADFAQGDPAFTAIAGERSFQGSSFESRVIVMAVDRVAMWGITFDDSVEEFSDPANFEGMTVATYPNPNTSYVVQKQLVEQAGLELGEDTFINEVAFGSEIAAIRNGQADIAHTIEPNATQVEQQGGKVVFSYPDAYGPLAFTGLMTSKRMIDEEPETVQRVVNAYEKALNYIHSDFEGAVEIAKIYLTDLQDETIRTALRRLLDSGCIPSEAKINPTSWEKLLEIRVDVGDLARIPKQNYIDNSFAVEALNRFK